MTTIIGISGSLRQASINTALLRHAAGCTPDGAEIVIESIAGIPLYDGDLETEKGVPAPVAALKDKIAAADGLLLATPEYNNSVPGVLKNTIDWLSRPADDIARVFKDKPVAIMGATPGGFGTRLSQSAWLPVLRTLGAKAWFGGRLEIPRAGQVFGDDGSITDDKTREFIQTFVDGFVAFVRNGA